MYHINLGKDTNDLHPSNILLISFIFEVFHFEISGKYTNDLHPLNISLISFIFEVFHFEISGKYNND